MGKIIKFPIYVDNTKASETAYGVLDVLRPEVRPIATAAVNMTASERGIWKSLSGITSDTSGVNLGAGLPIFISADIAPDLIYGGNTSDLYIRSINMAGTGFSVDKIQGVITLQSTQESPTGVIQMQYFNGGIEQESNTISCNDFATVNSKTLMRNISARTAIGKVMAKCGVGFSFEVGAPCGDVNYSVGTDANPSGLIEYFELPGTPNELMGFKYGTFLGDKVEYVELSSFADTTYLSGLSGITGEVSGTPNLLSTSNLIYGDDLKIFKSGDAVTHTYGTMDIVIFYDEFDKPMSSAKHAYNVYIPGGRTAGSEWGDLTNDQVIDKVQKYNLDNDTSSIDFNLTLPEGICRYAILQNADKMWYVGGQNTDVKGSIMKIDVFNETVSFATSVAEVDARRKADGIDTNAYGYVFGGGAKTDVSTNALKFQYSNETSTAVACSVQGFDQSVVAPWLSGTPHAYIAGGRTAASTNKSTAIWIFNVASETTYDSTLTIDTASYSLNRESDSLYGYFFGGHTAPGASIAEINKIRFATGTTISMSTSLPLNNGSAGCASDSNHSNIYMIGGNDNIAASSISSYAVKYSNTTGVPVVVNMMPVAVTEMKGATL